MLHLGTLIAVVFVYRQLIWRLIKEFGSLCVDIAHRNFKWSEMNHDRRLLFMLVIGLLPLFLLFLPIPGTGLDIKGLSDLLGSDSDILVEGLALLATKTDEEIQEYADTIIFEKKTAYSISSKEQLDEDIRFVREHGYAINNQRFEEGAISIAVPIFKKKALRQIFPSAFPGPAPA